MPGYGSVHRWKVCLDVFQQAEQAGEGDDALVVLDHA